MIRFNIAVGLRLPVSLTLSVNFRSFRKIHKWKIFFITKCYHSFIHYGYKTESQYLSGVRPSWIQSFFLILVFRAGRLFVYNNILISGGRFPRSFSACTTKLVVWCLRRPIRRMLTVKNFCTCHTWVLICAPLWDVR